MFSRLFKLSLIFGLMPIQSCLLSGCTSNRTEAQRQGSFDRQLAGLRAANFRGEIYMETGGTPLGVNISNVFSFGPQQMTLRASGQVDFTKPNQSLAPIPREAFAAFNRRLQQLESARDK